MTKQIKYIIVFFAFLSLASCRKWLDVKPEGVQLEEDAIQSQADLQAVLNSIYDNLANQYNGRIQLFNELLGDNMEKPQSGFTVPIYLRTTNFFNSDVGGLYSELYRAAFRVNYLMEKINSNTITVDAVAAKRMIAEAKFLRAMAHFELVKLWAQPAGYTADNSHLGVVIRNSSAAEPMPRSTVAQVYAFILNDLTESAADLPASNNDFATQNAAKALMAKVYFQMNNFAKTKELCDELIPQYTTDSTLNRFENAATSSEKIFSFISKSVQDNRAAGFIGNFRIANASSPSVYRLSKEMYLAATADANDKRAAYYAVFNAGTSAETYGTTKFNFDFLSMPFLYLTQLKLMRAEANAQLSLNLDIAISDVNDVLNRAYGNNSMNLSGSASKEQIIVEVRKQRRLEFALEGDRVQELKRVGALEDQTGSGLVKIRGSKWNCPGLALQFPSTEKTSFFVFNDEGNCD
jgi:hypothetical protein